MSTHIVFNRAASHYWLITPYPEPDKISRYSILNKGTVTGIRMIRSWMVIGAVTLLVALASSLIKPRGVRWFRRLRRPSWLTFEFAIPIIWTVVFICGAWSAYIVWEQDPGSIRTWLLMGFYLLVEMAIVAYNPVMFWLRSLRAGTIVGAIGTILGLILALFVLPISGWGFVLLLPYLIWSPIGTYTTWEMIQLNPEEA